MNTKRIFYLLVVAAIAMLLPMVISAQAPGPDENTLIVAQSQDATSLDPPQLGARPESNIGAHLFSGLYNVDQNGNLEPELAAAHSVSEDGLEHTFTLLEGLTCHDGSPLTADDAEYTFMRAADPELEFTGNTPGFVYSSLGFVEAEAVSELDVVVRLRAKKGTDLVLGLVSEVNMYCRESYEGRSLEDTANNPVGSGPYQLVEWVRDDYLLMEKWEDYALYDENAFDRIVWRVIPESSTRTAELIAGNVDIITNVPPDQHAAVNNSDSAEIQDVAGFRRIFMGFNFTDNMEGLPGAEAIKSQEVRVALQYAVDVPTICSALLGVECERANGLVNAPNDHPDLEPYPYDPERAEELLDEAGYPRGDDGVRFEVIVQGGRNRYLNDEQVILTICQYFDDIGVQTDCQIQDFGNVFIPNLVTQQAGPIYFVGSGGGAYAAQYEMADFSSPESNPNYGYWYNETWFTGWERLSAATSAEEEREIELDMLEAFYNDPPWLMLYFQPDFYGVSTRLDWEARRDEKLYVQDATLASE